MFIHARRGLPFSVDVQTLFDTFPTSLNGAALSWLGPNGFAPALKALDHDEGLVRYTIPAKDTLAWPLGTHATKFRYRAGMNGNPVKEFFVYLQVHEANDVIKLPDTYDHFGYLGTIGQSDEFSFIFNGSAELGGGVAGDNGWSPLFAIEADGDRRVLKLNGWAGGTGANPGYVGYYVGTSTFVPDIADGVDIRGEQGPPGADGEDGVGSTADSFQTVLVNGATSLVADSPTDTLNINSSTGISLTANATTDTLTINNTGVTSASAGAGVTVSPSTGAVVVTNTGVLTVNGAAGAVATPNLFGTVVVPGPLSIVADSTNDTLTLATGTGIAIAGNTGTDTITFTNTGVTSMNGSTGAVSTPNTFSTCSFGGTSLVADSTSDTLTISAGTGISLGANSATDTGTITNTGVTNLSTSGAGISASAATGSVVLSNTGVTSATAGAGITVSPTTGAINISSKGPALSVCSVLGSAVSTTSNTTPLLLTNQLIVVPSGGKVDVSARLLCRSAVQANGLYYGFQLVQGGVSAPEGPDVSYGSFDGDQYFYLGQFTYDATNMATFKGGYMRAKAGTTNYDYFVDQPLILSGEMGYARMRCTMYNGGVGTLTIQMFIIAKVSGSSVTAEKGSSFRADVITA